MGVSRLRIGPRFQCQVIPLLQEYFFEDWRRIQQVFNDVDTGEQQLVQGSEPAAGEALAGERRPLQGEPGDIARGYSEDLLVRLTLLEQSNLRVSSRAEGPEQSVSHDDAAALVDLTERMETPFVTWTGPNRLRIHQFVGLIRAGDLQLEILPKIDGLLEPAYIRRNLLTMLAKTQDLDVKESEAAAFAETSEPFACALARLYCRRLLEAVRRGLRQDYVLHHEALPRVRGKISWPSQLRLQATARLEFSCLFDERSEDTPVNRTFKAALLAAGPFLDEPRSSSLVSELRHSMASVSAACPSPEQLRRLHTDRMNRHLESLLSLAKLILGSRNPDFGRTSRPTRTTFALIWDMNVLFEEYVGRVAAEVLGARGCDVDLQENASSYLAREVLHRQGNAFL